MLVANLVSAQSPDLINTDWHIVKYSGEQFNSDLFPPPMPYTNYTTFSTATANSGPQLYSSFFNTITADIAYTGLDNFTVNNKTCTTANYTADNGEVNQFFGALCDFFNAPTVYYTIQLNGLHKSLVLNNAIFQTLYFSAGVLSTKESEVSQTNLAPNPADDNLIIKNSIEIKSYKIFDPTGKLIEEKKNVNAKTLNINIQDYQIGVYYIKLNEDKAMKFIKK